MGVYTYIKAHFHRNLKSTAVTMSVLISLLFASRYDSHISKKLSEIEDVYDNLEVRIELSNLTGTSTQDLSMPYIAFF